MIAGNAGKDNSARRRIRNVVQSARPAATNCALSADALASERRSLPGQSSESSWTAGVQKGKSRRAGRGSARRGVARLSPRFSSRFRSSFSFSPLRRRLLLRRPLSPAPMMQRSPQSLRRSLATPPNFASRSATTRLRPSTRRPAIAAISVRSAVSPLRPWRLSRLTCRPCRNGSRETRMRSALPLRADVLPAYPTQPNPARAPPLAV